MKHVNKNSYKFGLSLTIGIGLQWYLSRITYAS